MRTNYIVFHVYMQMTIGKYIYALIYVPVLANDAAAANRDRGRPCSRAKGCTQE